MAEDSGTLLENVLTKLFGKSGASAPPPQNSLFYGLVPITPEELAAKQQPVVPSTNKVLNSISPATGFTNEEADAYSKAMSLQAAKLGMYATPYLGEAAAMNDMGVYGSRAAESFKQGNVIRGLGETVLTGLNALGPLSLYGRASGLVAGREPNAISMFLPAQKDAAKQALALQAKGIAPELIHKQTGVVIGADGVPKVELPTHDAKINLGEYKPGDKATVGDILEHEGLFSQAPELANIKVRFTSEANNMSGEPSHTLDARNGIVYLSLAGNDAGRVKTGLIGKLQQLVGAHNDFASGGYHAYNKNAAHLDESIVRAASLLDNTSANKLTSAKDREALLAYIDNLQAHKARYDDILQNANNLEHPFWAKLADRDTPRLRSIIMARNEARQRDHIRPSDAKRLVANEMYADNAGATVNEYTKVRDLLGSNAPAYPFAPGQAFPSGRVVKGAEKEPLQQLALPSADSERNIMPFVRNWYYRGAGRALRHQENVVEQVAPVALPVQRKASDVAAIKKSPLAKWFDEYDALPLRGVGKYSLPTAGAEAAAMRDKLESMTTALKKRGLVYGSEKAGELGFLLKHKVVEKTDSGYALTSEGRKLLGK
jgi:hypothetical protein